MLRGQWLPAWTEKDRTDSFNSLMPFSEYCCWGKKTKQLTVSLVDRAVLYVDPCDTVEWRNSTLTQLDLPMEGNLWQNVSPLYFSIPLVANDGNNTSWKHYLRFYCLLCEVDPAKKEAFHLLVAGLGRRTAFWWGSVFAKHLSLAGFLTRITEPNDSIIRDLLKRRKRKESDIRGCGHLDASQKTWTRFCREWGSQCISSKIVKIWHFGAPNSDVFSNQWSQYRDTIVFDWLDSCFTWTQKGSQLFINSTRVKESEKVTTLICQNFWPHHDWPHSCAFY